MQVPCTALRVILWDAHKQKHIEFRGEVWNCILYHCKPEYTYSIATELALHRASNPFLCS